MRRRRKPERTSWIEAVAITIGGFALGAIVGPMAMALLTLGNRMDFFQELGFIMMGIPIGGILGAVGVHVLSANWRSHDDARRRTQGPGRPAQQQDRAVPPTE